MVPQKICIWNSENKPIWFGHNWLIPLMLWTLRNISKWRWLWDHIVRTKLLFQIDHGWVFLDTHPKKIKQKHPQTPQSQTPTSQKNIPKHIVQRRFLNTDIRPKVIQVQQDAPCEALQARDSGHHSPRTWFHDLTTRRAVPRGARGMSAGLLFSGLKNMNKLQNKMVSIYENVACFRISLRVWQHFCK